MCFLYASAKMCLSYNVSYRLISFARENVQRVLLEEKKLLVAGVSAPAVPLLESFLRGVLVFIFALIERRNLGISSTWLQHIKEKCAGRVSMSSAAVHTEPGPPAACCERRSAACSRPALRHPRHFTTVTHRLTANHTETPFIRKTLTAS